MPVRIQRKRSKGWRLPDGARSVTRPGVFGNPFAVKAAREAGYDGPDEVLARWCVNLFRRWVKGEAGILCGEAWEARRRKLLARLPELRGKDLACFCPLFLPSGDPHPCHADVLIELANR